MPPKRLSINWRGFNARRAHARSVRKADAQLATTDIRNTIVQVCGQTNFLIIQTFPLSRDFLFKLDSMFITCELGCFCRCWLSWQTCINKEDSTWKMLRYILDGNRANPALPINIIPSTSHIARVAQSLEA
jgi:hypothetical protein